MIMKIQLLLPLLLQLFYSYYYDMISKDRCCCRSVYTHWGVAIANRRKLRILLNKRSDESHLLFDICIELFLSLRVTHTFTYLYYLNYLNYYYHYSPYKFVSLILLSIYRMHFKLIRSYVLLSHSPILWITQHQQCLYTQQKRQHVAVAAVAAADGNMLPATLS